MAAQIGTPEEMREKALKSERIRLGYSPLISKATKFSLDHQGVAVFPAKEGESAVYRNTYYSDKLVTHLTEVPGFETLDTFEQVLDVAFKKYADRKCLGKRDKLEDGTVGPYKWFTYGETGELRTAFGSALAQLPELSPGAHIGIFSDNCVDWYIADYACHLNGYPSVPIYSSLGKEGVTYAVNHSDMEVIIGSPKTLAVLDACGPEAFPKLKYWIQMDMHDHTVDAIQAAVLQAEPDENATLPAPIESTSGSAPRYSFCSLLTFGRQHPAKDPPNRPGPDAIVSILYTSGSTGVPKGVMITQKGVLARCCGIDYADGSIAEKHSQRISRGLSYLPLSHVFERLCYYTMIFHSGEIALYQGDIKKLVDDIQAAKPSSLLGVPRVFSKIRDAILGKVQSASWLKRSLFEWAYASKKRAVYENRGTPWWDKLVFNKVQQVVGGEVGRFVCGGSAVDNELVDFLTIVFNAPVADGYGATETLGEGYVSYMPGLGTQKSGGAITCACEIKVIDVPELGYLAADKPCPRGELCIRSTANMTGYYKDEEKTKALDADGFFHTGDVARINENGTFTVIDRCKSFFKLMQGEYIAAEYLEAVYTRSSFVQMILILGDASARYPVAIVVPHEENLRRTLNTTEDLVGICKMPKVYDMILESMKEEATKAGLKPFEFIKVMQLEDELWTPENNCLTPTFKMRRGFMRQKYEAAAKELMAKLE